MLSVKYYYDSVDPPMDDQHFLYKIGKDLDGVKRLRVYIGHRIDHPMGLWQIGQFSSHIRESASAQPISKARAQLIIKLNMWRRDE